MRALALCSLAVCFAAGGAAAATGGRMVVRDGVPAPLADTVDWPCLHADSLDFGTVSGPVEDVLRFLTIVNEDFQAIGGQVEDCPPFHGVDGGSFFVAPFGVCQLPILCYGAPEGNTACELSLGLPCGTVTCTVTGNYLANCLVWGNTDFGVVSPDMPATRSCWIENLGNTPLDGRVETDSPAFVVVAGADYHVGPGGASPFVVQFQAGVPGDYSDTVLLDDPCNDLSCTARVEAVTVEARDSPAAPALGAAHPNPFNPATTIEYSLARTERVRLTVQDLAGRQVTVLEDGLREAGPHRAVLDGTSLPSGVYLIRLEAGGQTRTTAVTLRK